MGGPHRNPVALGNGGQRHATDNAGPHGLAPRFRHRTQRVANASLAVRCNGGVKRARLLWRGHTTRVVLEFLPTPASLHRIDRSVDRDAIQPRPQSRGTSEVPVATTGRDEYILDHIDRVLLAAYATHDLLKKRAMLLQ